MGVGAAHELGLLMPSTTPLYAYNYSMSSYFPTWGAYDYSTWGLESVASPWLYEDYANPYYAAPSRRRPSSSSPCWSRPTPGRRRSPRQ